MRDLKRADVQVVEAKERKKKRTSRKTASKWQERPQAWLCDVERLARVWFCLVQMRLIGNLSLL